MALRLPKLDKSMPIVELFKGKFLITPAFQRWWQESVVKSDGTGDDLPFKVNTVDIRYTSSDASLSYNPSQVQELMDRMEAVCRALRNNTP